MGPAMKFPMHQPLAAIRYSESRKQREEASQDEGEAGVHALLTTAQQCDDADDTDACRRGPRLRDANREDYHNHHYDNPRPIGFA